MDIDPFKALMFIDPFRFLMIPSDPPTCIVPADTVVADAVVTDRTLVVSLKLNDSSPPNKVPSLLYWTLPSDPAALEPAPVSSAAGAHLVPFHFNT